MKALRFLGPWQMDVADVPDPVPGPGEVAVRITATGICGSDIHGVTGENGRRHPGQIMGHETTGTVAAFGPNDQSGLRIGTPVTINPVFACHACQACADGREQACAHRKVMGVDPSIVSAFAQIVVAPQSNVIALPAGLPQNLGALAEPLSVGYHAATRGQAGPGDRVLVIGGGPIGQACVLGAQRLGVRQIVVAEPQPDRRALCGALGADVIDPTDDRATASRRALDGPASLVFDAVGSTDSLAFAIDASAIGARLVLVGMNQPNVELRAYSISTEERTIIGSFCYSAREFADTVAWLETAHQRIGPLIGGAVSLSEAGDTFLALARGELKASKILIRLQEEATVR